jgi:hypothetical protein
MIHSDTYSLLFWWEKSSHFFFQKKNNLKKKEWSHFDLEFRGGTLFVPTFYFFAQVLETCLLTCAHTMWKHLIGIMTVWNEQLLQLFIIVILLCYLMLTFYENNQNNNLCLKTWMMTSCFNYSLNNLTNVVREKNVVRFQIFIWLGNANKAIKLTQHRC